MVPRIFGVEGCSKEVRRGNKLEYVYFCSREQPLAIIQLPALKMNINTFRLSTSDSVNPVAVRLTTAVLSAAVPSIPVHFIAAVDNSGSMDDQHKLANVIRSLECLLDFLKDEDEFSLLTFESRSVIRLRRCRMTATNKEAARSDIRSIHTVGGTNLELALLSVQEIVDQPTSHAQQTQTLLLLTDGEANEGKKDLADLTPLVQQLVNANPTLTVNTAGYGLTHNAELLAAMASTGGGSYNIVSNISDVATVFGDIMGGLRTTLFQQVKLYIPPTVRQISKYASFVPIVTTGAAATATTLADINPKTEIFAGDLRESGELLLLFDTLPINETGTTNMDLRYIDAHMGLATLIVNLVLRSPSAEDTAAAHVAYLRFKVVDFLQSMNTGSDRLALIDQGLRLTAEIDTFEVTPVLAMLKRELEQSVAYLQAPPGDDVNPSRVHRMTSQQHSAYIGMGRGMYSTPSDDSTPDDPPLTSVFSNISQRQTSQCMRNASEPAATATATAAATATATPDPMNMTISLPPPPIRMSSLRRTLSNGEPSSFVPEERQETRVSDD